MADPARGPESRVVNLQSLESVPPHDNEAEQAVLAALMLDGGAVRSICGRLTPRAFYRHDHSVIFEAIDALHQKDMAVDLVTVKAELEARGLLERAGGFGYLVDLASSVPTTGHAEYYARLVIGGATLRAIAAELKGLLPLSYECPLDEAQTVLDEAFSRLNAIEVRGSSGLFAAGDLVAEFYEDLEARQKERGVVTGVVETPFYDLNHMLTGFKPKQLIILAARPSMGKTALAQAFAWHAAKEGTWTLFVSLEMSKEELMRRLVSDIADIEIKKLEGAREMTEAEWDRVSAAMGTIKASHLIIQEATDSFGVDDLKRAITDLRVQNKRVGLAVVDYLQLMEGGKAKKGRGEDNRNQEVSAISRGLKGMARAFNIPIIALSQLSRGVESRPDKRPILSDLRDSGSIEQDADIVMFVYRDEYYTGAKSESPGIAELNTAKHRNGPVGKIDLTFLKARTRFGDVTDSGFLPIDGGTFDD